MFTRQQYLNGECSHQEYYVQYVNRQVWHLIANAFPVDKLRAAHAVDKNFHTIELSYWDQLACFIQPNLDLLNKLGESDTLSWRVCVLKHCAKEFLNAHS
jgi:hypothetical protein